MTWSVGAGLEGKGVILTGAAGGIGAAVARAFASAGAKVMAVDLDQADSTSSSAGSRAAATSGGRRPARPRHPRGARRAGASASSAGCTCSRTSPPSCGAGARLTR